MKVYLYFGFINRLRNLHVYKANLYYFCFSALFSKVMFAIQGSYHINNLVPSNTGYFTTASSPSVSIVCD